MFGEHTSCCDGGWLRHSGDHAPHRHQQDGCLAVAGAVHERRRQRSAARQDPSVAHPAPGWRSRAKRRRSHTGRSARRDHTLDCRRNGPGERHQCQFGAAHLAAAWPAAASGAPVQAFKLSNDQQFASKLRDIVGLYVDPPAHTVVLSIDEKSQIQSLDRTQPGLPMKKGRCGTMTHDYKRHGTTTLFAPSMCWTAG
jgi:hypothetical protein